MSTYPKLKTMIIRNFRGISKEIVIDLDDIVILVGNNNSGKSSILRAYECAVNNEKILIEDFPNREIKPDALPQVELHTLVDDESSPSKKEWCKQEDDGVYLVKEVWTWAKADKPERLGYRVDENRWAVATDKPKQPWATDNVASTKRPRPHRVSTFDSPEMQSDAIKSLVNAILEEKIKSFEPSSAGAESFETLADKFQKLKTEFSSTSKKEMEEISNDISEIVSGVIPNQKLKFEINDEIKHSSFTIYDPNDIEISLGDEKAMLPITSQGSGARRTLLWAVLKKLADLGYEAKASGKGKKYEEIKGCESHILLLDEPEISLHPQAIRDACRVLYSLPKNPKWQVMVTTHSPYFIDLSEDHTTISRIERDDKSENRAINLYKPEDVKLTEDEKENIKLLNLVDSHVLEFFFGGKVLLVEGDTEYSVFNKIKQDMIASGDMSVRDTLIIRARGKVQIAALMKILNHFKKQYFVLHDTDTTETKSRRKVSSKGKKIEYEVITITNPAWTNNEKIMSNMSEYSSVFASVENFELAVFGEAPIDGKPINALEKIKDTVTYQKVKDLLLAIISDGKLPEGIVKWKTMDELKSIFNVP